MFEVSVKKLDLEKKNKILKRNINLNENLDCFILISSDDHRLTENLLDISIEHLVDKISKEDTYNDFSIALEHINSYLKTWKKDQKESYQVDMIIGILNNNSYTFSNIGNSSSYLINKNSEVNRLTNKGENKKDFSFISSGNLINGDIVVSSSIELFDYLSESDLIDGLVLSEDIDIFNKNIKNILKSEIVEENILVSSLKYINKNILEKENHLQKVSDFIFKLADTKIIKFLISLFFRIKTKVIVKSKITKNIFISLGIIICLVVLFSTLSKVVSITTQTENKEIATENLNSIKSYVRLASENIDNEVEFENNIKNAIELIKQIEGQEMFLNDIEKLNEDINILKKQFNKIAIFEGNNENLLYNNKGNQAVNIVYNDGKTYIINKKSVVGPIIGKTDTKPYIFDKLDSDDFFKDTAFIGSDLYILTNKGKVVKFAKNNYFTYVDVIGQDTWGNIKEIDSYATNIYTLDSKNQINKHSEYGDLFKAGVGYITNEDLEKEGEIISIAIDGGFYLLKADLSMLKFFSSPYRLESLVLNKLPENYNIENKNNIKLKARKDLNNVYLLLNNKIWVFQPNTTNYNNTQSLTYLGQIEGATEKIKDFYIEHDGKIIILFESGIYNMDYEISGDTIFIK